MMFGHHGASRSEPIGRSRGSSFGSFEPPPLTECHTPNLSEILSVKRNSIRNIQNGEEETSKTKVLAVILWFTLRK